MIYGTNRMIWLSRKGVIVYNFVLRVQIAESQTYKSEYSLAGCFFIPSSNNASVMDIWVEG